MLLRIAVIVCLLLPPPGVAAFEPLPRGALAAHDIDSRVLEDAMALAAGIQPLQAVVVVRDGCVVGEWFRDGQPARCRAVWSVTKSVMSTLIGIALERGLISDLDAPMIGYLPAALVPQDARKHSISVRHLLTMTSGLQWSERSNWYEWVTQPHPAHWILSRSLEADPGSLWVYSTAATHLLSVVLSEATGESARDFGEQYLFGPLGFDGYGWESDPQGYVFGGHGLFLRTEDMAKLGVVFVDDGVFDGERVVSAEWCRQATSIEYRLGAEYGPLRQIDYGRLWWVDSSLEHDVYTAWGFSGQFVFCVPELDLVVATSTLSAVDWETADRQEQMVLEWIVSDLLPSVMDRGSLPRRSTGRTRAVGAQPQLLSAGAFRSSVVASSSPDR